MRQSSLEDINGYSLMTSYLNGPFTNIVFGGLPFLLIIVSMILTKKTIFLDPIVQGIFIVIFLNSTVSLFRIFDTVSGEYPIVSSRLFLTFYLLIFAITILSLIRSPFKKVNILKNENLFKFLSFIFSAVSNICLLFGSCLLVLTIQISTNFQ